STRASLYLFATAFTSIHYLIRSFAQVASAIAALLADCRACFTLNAACRALFCSPMNAAVVYGGFRFGRTLCLSACASGQSALYFFRTSATGSPMPSIFLAFAWLISAYLFATSIEALRWLI